MLGHCADSQTVCSPSPRASFFRLWKLSPTGAFARSHCGLGRRGGGASSIWISWEAPAIPSILPVHFLSNEKRREREQQPARRRKRLRTLLVLLGREIAQL